MRADRRLRGVRLFRAADRRAAGRLRRCGRCWPGARRRGCRSWRARLGGLEVARADALRPNTVFVARGAGRRADHDGRPVREVRRAGGARGDRGGLHVHRHLRASRRSCGGCSRSSRRRRPQAGAVLLPSMGYDYVPGRWPARWRCARRAPTRCASTSATTCSTARWRSCPTARARRSSACRWPTATRSATARWSRVRPAERVRAFTVDGVRREALSAGGVEHFTLPAAFPGLQEVNVYLGWFGPFTRPIQASVAAGRGRPAPPGRPRRDARGRRADGRPGPRPGAGHDAGRPLLGDRRGVLGRTAICWRPSRSPAWTATSSPRGSSPGPWGGAVRGVGTLGPVEAFGLDALERRRVAGIERVR